MAKTSPPLEITEHDRIVLNELAGSDDAESALRARIVLACGGNKQNKEIAGELNVTPVTVSKWKEAYRRNGLPGIQVKHSGGRKSKYDDNGTLQDKINAALAGNPDWTAKDIAGHLGIPGYKVQGELKKMGIHLERQRLWRYSSHDPVAQWKPRLLFLYRSHGCGVIIACEDSHDLPGAGRCKGVFELTNRKLSQDMAGSLTPVTLQGMLQSAHACIDGSPSNSPRPLGTCVAEAIESWNAFLGALKDGDGSPAAFHVFSFGCDPGHHGGQPVPVQHHRFGTEKEMADAFTHWMGGLCSGQLHVQVENFASDLCAYGQEVKEDTPALVWRLETPSGDNAEEAVAEPGDGSLEMQLRNRNFSQGEIEEVLEALNAIADSMPDNGTHSSALLIQKANGRLHLKPTALAQAMPDMDSFNFKDTDGFIRDLSKLEEDSGSLARKVRDASMDLYLETAKKN